MKHHKTVMKPSVETCWNPNLKKRKRSLTVSGLPAGSKEVWRVVFKTRKELEPRWMVQPVVSKMVQLEDMLNGVETLDPNHTKTMVKNRTAGSFGYIIIITTILLPYILYLQPCPSWGHCKCLTLLLNRSRWRHSSPQCWTALKHANSQFSLVLLGATLAQLPSKFEETMAIQCDLVSQRQTYLP